MYKTAYNIKWISIDKVALKRTNEQWSGGCHCTLHTSPLLVATRLYY